MGNQSSSPIEYDPGLIEYEPGPVGRQAGPTRIEASQKGWFLVRALGRMLRVVAAIESSSEHDWNAYEGVKMGVLTAFEQFERWHGR